MLKSRAKTKGFGIKRLTVSRHSLHDLSSGFSGWGEENPKKQIHLRTELINWLVKERWRTYKRVAWQTRWATFFFFDGNYKWQKNYQKQDNLGKNETFFVALKPFYNIFLVLFPTQTNIHMKSTLARVWIITALFVTYKEERTNQHAKKKKKKPTYSVASSVKRRKKKNTKGRSTFLH